MFKFLKFIAAPVLAILSTCCGKPPVLPDGGLVPKAAVIEFHADTDFTPEERGNIDFSANVWNTQTNGQAKVTVVYDLDFGSVDSLKAAMDQNTIVRNHCDEDPNVDEGTLGWTPPWGGIHDPQGRHSRMMLCVDRMDEWGSKTKSGKDNYWRQTVIHEMGHALGLSHVAHPNALMFPSIVPDRKACLKVPDLVEFCSMNVCNKPTFPCE